MALPARTNAALALPGVVLLALFFALPVVAVAVDALREGGAAFARVFTTAGFWRAAGGSTALTLVAATLSTLVGVAVALHLSRLSSRRRTVLSFVIALPLTFSGLIVAYGFILGYGRAGFVTQILARTGLDAASIGAVLFTPMGLAFASSYYLIPRVVIGMLPVLVNFDRVQLAAAESLGATQAQAFRQVLLPQVAAPVVASFCLVAAVVFGAYGTALALVGTQLPILPLRLYSLISETGSDFPAAAALALLITAVCSTIITTGEWVERSMNATFRLDRANELLFDAAGRRFDPRSRRWLAADKTAVPRTAETLDVLAAVSWLQRESGHPLRVPIGVIGPREATPAQLTVALEVGELLGDCRLTVICGGRQGVMQAVCEGTARVGGLAVGLLPDADAASANPFVNVAIATGIGEARNALIARASFCLIAIGDSFGTLSEVALSRQFGKLVVGLEGAARIEGVEHVSTPRDAVERIAEVVLGLT